ncbi:MAG: CRTAC1 family protein, partial [Acidobacteriota bacterium]
VFTGADDNGDAIGAIAGDTDNDGDLDLYVLNFDQPNVLYRNMWIEDGAVPANPLRFVDITRATDPTPLTADGQFGVAFAIDNQILLDNSLSAAFADVDRDGDLDLYVGNHNGWYIGFVPPFSMLEGPDPRPGRRDIFYRNDGGNVFTEVTMTMPGTQLTGFETATGAQTTTDQRFSSTNALIFGDFNGDRWPELFITNKIGVPQSPTQPDPDADMMYLNGGGASPATWTGFQADTYNISATFGRISPAAMGVDVGDVDNDGDLDIYIADIAGVANVLYRNTTPPGGALAFTADTSLPGVFNWGTKFLDVDNNGTQDIYVGSNNGSADLLYHQPTLGTFNEIGVAAGVGQTGDTRGVMTADYNRDGWQDVFIINRLGNPILYENTSATAFPNRRWLYVELVGNPAGPGPFQSSVDAIGARVFVSADLNGNSVIDVGEIQNLEVRSGSSNAASTSSLILEFGVGQATTADVFVLWPSGATHVFLANATNQCLQIDEATASILGPC